MRDAGCGRRGPWTGSGAIPRVITGSQAPTAGRKATALSIANRSGCAAGLADLAKRLECAQLAGAFGPPTAPKSGSKLHALQALREVRLRLYPDCCQEFPQPPGPSTIQHLAIFSCQPAPDQAYRLP